MKKNKINMYYVIPFLSYLMIIIASFKNKVLAAGGTSTKGNGGSISIPNPLGGTSNLSALIQSIAWDIYHLAFILAFIMLVWGGIQYIMSGGNSGKIQNAKNTILYAVIGIAVVLIGRGFITLIQNLL